MKSKLKGRISPTIEKEIINKYCIKMKSMSEIHQEYGISVATVHNILRRNNIQSRPACIVPDHRKRHSRRHSVNETYFNIIDSKDKAYWLGFILADGTIHEDHVRLVLSPVDIRHLHKFKHSLESDHPVRVRCHNVYGKKHKQAVFAPYSKKLVRGLVFHGVIPRKSLVAKPCSGVPDEYMIDFWRGVIDGDGSIFTDNHNRKRLSLVGSFKLVTAFRRFALQYVTTKNKVNLVRNQTFYVAFSDQKAVCKLLELLYSHSSVFLTRKKRLALKYAKELNTKFKIKKGG